MKNKPFLFLFTMLFYFSASAQTDITFWYWSKDGILCAKDTASSSSKIYPEGETWTRKEYIIANNLLHYEGTYADKECRKAHGKHVKYNDDGTADYVSAYDSGTIINRTYYHSNGAKKGYISYAENLQQGWDEHGKEIKDYITESFPALGQEWRNYITKNVKPQVAVEAGLPEGHYRGLVKFIIDKQGNIANVVAAEVPRGCAACGTEAIRVISNGPRFKPPIRNGEVVDYAATQPVLFYVEDGNIPIKKKGYR